MKITCQACQSKYTIADDKIQGKVAKIRCRKCGATVLVDASAGGTSAPDGAAAGQAIQSAGAATWSVATSEGDPRSMTLNEVVDAYNTGVITGETYVWKDGMADWAMLAQCEEIVMVLRGAAPIEEPPTQLRPTSTAAAASERPAKAEEMPLFAGLSGSGQDEGSRSRTADPFGAGSSEEEEEVATSVPSNVVARIATTVGTKSTAATGGGAVVSTTSTSGSATGSRDEQSLLFSLSALTGGSAANGAASSNTPVKKNDEDSGLIDLNALAKAQSRQKASAPATDAGLFPAPFMFPAALGNVEVPATEAIDIQPVKKKSKAPLFIGLGVAAVGVIAVVAIAGSQKPVETPAPAASAIEAISTPEALATHAPEPAPSPTQSAAPPPETKKAAGPSRGAQRGQKQHNDAPVTGAAPPPPQPATPPPPARNKCGCPAGDLQCQIRCSATGK
jgi:predicted Zn finger-like uncharacterized protein